MATSSADRPTPEAGSSPPPRGGTIQSTDFQSHLSVGADPETAQPLPVPPWDLDSIRPQGAQASMHTAEQRLFEILVEHDVAVAERNARCTETVWPDLSDIHIETRRKIFDLFRNKDVLDHQDQVDLPLELTSVSDHWVLGRQVFSIKPEGPIDPSRYLNQVVLINGKRYRVTHIDRHPVAERVNTLLFGLLVIPA